MVGYPFDGYSGRGTWQQFLAVPENTLLAVPDSVPDHVAAQLYVGCPLLKSLVEPVFEACSFEPTQDSDLEHMHLAPPLMIRQQCMTTAAHSAAQPSFDRLSSAHGRADSVQACIPWFCVHNAIHIYSHPQCLIVVWTLLYTFTQYSIHPGALQQLDYAVSALDSARRQHLVQDTLSYDLTCQLHHRCLLLSGDDSIAPNH